MNRPRDKEAVLQLEAIKELKNSQQDLLYEGAFFSE